MSFFNKDAINVWEIVILINIHIHMENEKHN